MPIRTELNLKLPNSPGACAALARALAGERVDIRAFALERGGALRLVVDNHVRAAAVLRARRHQVAEREVVAVDLAAGSGSLAPVLELVAAGGLNLEYAYGGAGLGSATVVLGVDDAVRAAAAAGL